MGVIAATSIQTMLICQESFSNSLLIAISKLDDLYALNFHVLLCSGSFAVFSRSEKAFVLC